MKKYISVITCAVLILLVFFDIFDFYPKLHGTAYFLFNLPNDSYKEAAVWLVMSFVAITRLIEFKVGYLKYFKISGDVFSVALIFVVVFKLVQTIEFAFSEEVLELMESTVSFFSITSGRSVMLVILAALLVLDLWGNYNKKY